MLSCSLAPRYNYQSVDGNRLYESGDCNRVFQFRGQPIKDIRTGQKPACRKAKIKYGRFEKYGFVFHDLRHTFNTNMRKAGIAGSVIMRITGHSTREMFDRYNTIYEVDARQAVGQLQRYLTDVDQSPKILNAFSVK